MKKMTLCLVAMSVLAGCSSLRPDYYLSEASQKTPPVWLANAEAAAKDKKELTQYRFFTADAENVAKRLCKQEAEAQAKQKIASEISQSIANAFEAAYASHDDEATGKLKDLLQSSIKQNLNGVQVAKEYWEKRKYSVELGAPDDVERYKCDVAVKISIKDLERAVKDARNTAIKQARGDEKEAVSKAVDTFTETLKATDKVAAPSAGTLF